VFIFIEKYFVSYTGHVALSGKFIVYFELERTYTEAVTPP
jgi:hypothetical protein